MFTLFKNRYILLGILLVIGYIVYQQHTIGKLKEKLVVTNNNVKAYQNGIQSWKDNFNREHVKVTEFQYSLYQLNRSNDSLDRKLTKIIKESSIKDKNLIEAGIIITELKAKLKANSSNTITTVDTDTLKCQRISDSTFLVNEVCFNPIAKQILSVATTVNNEQSIIFSHHKETINPPRKLFIRRWFQKKHTLCNIEIVNSNPYINTKQSKFIKIIK